MIKSQALLQKTKKNRLKSLWLYQLINALYMVYAGLFWVLTFLLLFPLFVLADFCRWDKFGLQLNHYWANFFFPLIGVPVKIEYEQKLDRHSNYIFCANHFSYLDIAVMPFMPVPVQFVGKLAIGKVPFFGYMFKRFHITVDRSSIRERYATYRRAVKALKDGFSLGIFPEGGIKSKSIPKMSQFKEGPFRMSVETGVPVVPISFIDNWHMFPDNKTFRFNRAKCRIKVHKPIDPSSYSLESLDDFQQQTYHIIQKEIDQHYPTSI